jgi:hypothetical protein
MDLRWLSAPDDEVAAAMATLRRDSRPAWVPTKRQMLVHVNNCLMLWYLCIVFLAFGVRVDSYDAGQVSDAVLRGLAVTMTIFAAWLYGTYRLYRWAAQPPSPRARLREWRLNLTALANGFEPQPGTVATFSSLISTAGERVRQYPRFVAPGVEFGNLVHTTPRSTEWHYLALTLPAPLPHLILDAAANNGIVSDLPAGVDRGQRISLEGDFDRWFRVYAPLEYRLEAFYFLTPDVMTALIRDASDYNVEMIDDTLVFFTSQAVDFATPEPWLAVHRILTDAASRLLNSAERYRDERVPGQEVPPVISAIRAAIDHPHVPWVAPRPRIGPDGRRLTLRDRRNGIWPVLGAIGWFALLTFLYVVPGIFAFAGLMSIIDGW